MRSSSRWRVVWLQWIKRLLTVPSWPWRFGWIFQHRKIKTIKIFKIIFQTFWLLRVAQLTVQCIVSPVYNIWWQKMILLPQLCSHLEFEWQKTKHASWLWKNMGKQMDKIGNSEGPSYYSPVWGNSTYTLHSNEVRHLTDIRPFIINHHIHPSPPV